MTIFGDIRQWSNEMQKKKTLCKITFRGCIINFCITSGFHYSTFDDFKKTENSSE